MRLLHCVRARKSAREKRLLCSEDIEHHSGRRQPRTTRLENVDLLYSPWICPPLRRLDSSNLSSPTCDVHFKALHLTYSLQPLYFKLDGQCNAPSCTNQTVRKCCVECLSVNGFIGGNPLNPKNTERGANCYCARQVFSVCIDLECVAQISACYSESLNPAVVPGRSIAMPLAC